MTLIDGLRGIAALGVVLDHLGGVWAAPSRHTGDLFYRLMRLHFQFAHGVDIFFVISGFVIVYSLRHADVSLRFAGRFALRRSIRLDPPYWVAIAFAVTMGMIRHKFGNTPTLTPSKSLVAAHLVYLQGILGLHQIDPVFWTLCLEVQFYLILILVLCVCRCVSGFMEASARSIGAWTILALFVVSLFAAIFCDEPSAPTCRTFWPHWYKFLLGAVLCLSWQEVLPRRIAVLAVASVAGAASVRYTVVAHSSVLGDFGIYTALATGSLITISAGKNRLFAWLDAKPLLFLGTISYSLYLCNYPLIEAGRGLQKRLVGSSAVGALVVYLALLALCIGLALAIYQLIERPSLRLAARIRPSLGRSQTHAASERVLGGGLERPLEVQDRAQMAIPF